MRSRSSSKQPAVFASHLVIIRQLLVDDDYERFAQSHTFKHGSGSRVTNHDLKRITIDENHGKCLLYLGRLHVLLQRWLVSVELDSQSPERPRLPVYDK